MEKLCFLCNKPLEKERRMNIDEIKNNGLKYFIVNEREKFLKNELILKDSFNIKFVCYGCCENIEKEFNMKI
ncbi:MAG: hypothetical protein WCV92_05180 [Candidatus Buchananbacteria bacterium]|jgi:hypothetical protein